MFCLYSCIITVCVSILFSFLLCLSCMIYINAIINRRRRVGFAIDYSHWIVNVFVNNDDIHSLAVCKSLLLFRNYVSIIVLCVCIALCAVLFFYCQLLLISVIPDTDDNCPSSLLWWADFIIVCLELVIWYRWCYFCCVIPFSLSLLTFCMRIDWRM